MIIIIRNLLPNKIRERYNLALLNYKFNFFMEKMKNNHFVKLLINSRFSRFSSLFKYKKFFLDKKSDFLHFSAFYMLTVCFFGI